MKAEDIESAMAERNAASVQLQVAATATAPRELAKLIGAIPIHGDAHCGPGNDPPARFRIGPDPSIPRIYQGPPDALLARCVERIQRAVTSVDRGQRYGALIAGPSGCGKSSAAAWALRRWRASVMLGGEKPTLAWLDALEATDAERRYKLGSGDPEALAEAYCADWLVLDDVGTTCSPTLVQLVLARRYQAGLPTIVTTGLEREQLVQHIGAATVRRIIEFEGRAGLLVDCHSDPSKTAKGSR